MVPVCEWKRQTTFNFVKLWQYESEFAPACLSFTVGFEWQMDKDFKTSYDSYYISNDVVNLFDVIEFNFTIL